MLHKIPVFTRILCALPALLCLCTCLCGGTRPTPERILPAVSEDGGAGEWHLCLTVSDSDPHNPSLILALKGQLPPDADPAALAAVRITVELPVAWRVTTVERTKDVSDSLTVTVSVEGARVVILADGELKDLVGIEFLISSEAREPSDDSTPAPRVTAHSEGVAYYDDARQSVARIPVTDAILDAVAWGGEGDTFPEESATSPPASEVPTTTPPLNDEKSPVTATLVGCQETPCTDSQFSVRFIYKITDAEAEGQGTLATGVICTGGRGVIEVEDSVASSVTEWVNRKPTVTAAHTDGAGGYFYLVTFRGLTAAVEWTFVAERGDGQRVVIRWRDGKFLG